MHHTNCGMEGLTEEEMAAKTGAPELDFLTFDDVERSVQADVDTIRSCEHLPRDLVAGGAVYDV